MNAILKQLAANICDELYKRRTEIIGHNGRFPKEQLFQALNGCKPVLEQAFGGPARSRRAVGKKRTSQKPTNGLRRKKELEYLVDYSISRYFITQAIRQAGFGDPQLRDDQFYEILLAVESELGDDDEVLRDFLKLLDIKSRIKCLIFYKKRPNDVNAEALYERINWVVSHHKFFDPEEGFLFVGLPKPKAATLTDDIELRCIKDKKVAPLQN